MKFIFVHGTGHTAASWEETISYMKNKQDIVCPDLSAILNGKEASYPNLCSAFAEYCNQFEEQIHLSVGLFFEVSGESEVTGSDRHSAQNTKIYALRSKRDFPFFPKIHV